MMRFKGNAVWIALAVTLVACQKKEEAPQAHEAGPARDVIAGMPKGCCSPAQKDSILNAVKAAKIPDSEFISDTNSDDNNDIGGGVRGWIKPHKDANDAPLAHGRVLARIEVSNNVPAHGWKFGIRNYWIAAKFDGHTGWTGVMVNTKYGTVDTVTMSKKGRPGTHHDPMSRWIPLYRTASAFADESRTWTTCDGGDCCCEGPTCNGGPIPLDSIPPRPDSLPPKGPYKTD